MERQENKTDEQKSASLFCLFRIQTRERCLTFISNVIAICLWISAHVSWRNLWRVRCKTHQVPPLTTSFCFPWQASTRFLCTFRSSLSPGTEVMFCLLLTVLYPVKSWSTVDPGSSSSLTPTIPACMNSFLSAHINPSMLKTPKISTLGHVLICPPVSDFTPNDGARVWRETFSHTELETDGFSQSYQAPFSMTLWETWFSSSVTPSSTCRKQLTKSLKPHGSLFQHLGA